LAGAPQQFKETLVARGLSLREVESSSAAREQNLPRELEITVEGDQGVSPLLKEALEAGASVVEVEQERETLEELFVRNAVASGD
jgi:hypothetical protein